MSGALPALWQDYDIGASILSQALRECAAVRHDWAVRWLHDIFINQLADLNLLRGGAIVRAAINIGASVILCIVAVALGHSLAAHFNEVQSRLRSFPLRRRADQRERNSCLVRISGRNGFLTVKRTDRNARTATWFGTGDGRSGF
jgi:hypothetical protein